MDGVPGKVLASFRARRTVQAVADVEAYTTLLFNRLARRAVQPSTTEKTDILALLSDEGCEDVVAAYLQLVEGYLLIPSSCKRDTLSYEFVLQHHATGEKAVAQVKTGNIALDPAAFANAPYKAYLFAASGQ